MPKNILIFNPFGIGDTIFSTPLISVLSKKIPEAKIYYISNKRSYTLLKNNPIISDVIIYEKDYFRKLLRRSRLRFAKELINFLKAVKSVRADILIDLSLNYQASLIGKLLGIKKRIGFNYRNRGRFLTDKIELEGFEKKHVAFYYLDLLKPLNIDAEKENFTQIFTSENDDKWAETLLREHGLCGKFVMAIIPGGGKSWGKDARYRRWPISNFAHVADRLIDTLGVEVVLLGDKSEKKLCDTMASFMRNRVYNMGGITDLGQFMSLVKKCNIILCNEGGPLHIAVALKKPTISIFGPVDEKIYGPYAADMSKHLVVSERNKCRPCYSRFKHKDCDTLICLNSISQDKVFGAVKTIMERIKNHEVRHYNTDMEPA